MSAWWIVGVVLLVRVVDGTLKPKDRIKLMGAQGDDVNHTSEKLVEIRRNA